MGSDPLHPRARNVPRTACDRQPEVFAHARLRIMRSQLMTRRRVTAGLVAGTLLLAACGGADEGAAGDPVPQVEESSESGDAAAADSSEAIDAPAGSTTVDLVGADVLPESEFEGNLLPSVIVDDINTGRKVNFRNLVPQEKPILLWMWAPH